MQVVSESQRKSSKGRLKIEKHVISFVYICTAVQLLMISAFIVQVTLHANRTLQNSIFISNDFLLNPVLIYKTKSCNYSTVENLNAFDRVTLTLNAQNVNIIIADHALAMKSLVILGVLTVIFGIINRVCIDVNFFALKFHNLDIKKDIFSATELLLLTYLVQEAHYSQSRASLLQNYFSSCGVISRKYLPWVSFLSLYLIVGAGYFTYLVTLIIYLRNTLPKYGIMTPDEIEEYRVWLRMRKAEAEQARVFIEQAKKAHARMYLLRNRNMPIESSAFRDNFRHQTIPTPIPAPTPMPPMTPENVSMTERVIVHPHYDIYSNPNSTRNLPPPQMFGAQPDLLNYAGMSYDSHMHQPVSFHDVVGEFPQSTGSSTMRQRNIPQP